LGPYTLIFAPLGVKFARSSGVKKPQNCPLSTGYLKYRRFTMLPVRIKARFSRLLRHPAWKRRGPVLISALHKFVSYGTYYLDTYALTYSPGCTWDTGSLNL